MEIIDCDVRTPGFSIQMGYYLAHASVAAYGGNGDWPQSLGLGESVRSFACGEFHGFVAARRDAIIVAFRGTESVGNALTDAETSLVHNPFFSGLVHSGFAGAVQAVYPTVRVLVSTVGSNLPVFVTGHSLGGAMATLVANRLASEGFLVRAVYTFGSPRAGDRHFRDNYQLPNFRFVNDNDLVPHLPLRWCYKHVGELKLLTRAGELLEEINDWKDKKRELVRHAKQIQKAHRYDDDPPLKLTEFDWLADHHMAGYLNGIKKLLPKVPRRRQPDFPGDDLDGVRDGDLAGVPLRFIDEPAAAVPRPKFLSPPKPAVPTIAESALAAAFARQKRQ